MPVTFKPGIYHLKGLSLAVLVTIGLTTFLRYRGQSTVQTATKGRHIHSFDYADNNSNEVYPFHMGHMTERQKEYCKQNGPKQINPATLDRIYYDDKYKVIYCSVPKVACTNWRRMLLIMSGKLNVTDPSLLPSPDVHGKYEKYLSCLSDLSRGDILYRINNYYKFVFTRDPFERVLSAYKNKLHSKNDYFNTRYGKKIIQRYRVGNTEQSQGDDVTFQEFVHYLTDFTRKDPFESHWNTITNLCQPCLMKYDFVGSMDNMNEDSDRILKKVGASNVVQFPKRSARYKHPTTGNNLNDYYSKIPPGLINQLLEVYSSDFIMFNLTVPLSMKRQLDIIY